MFFRCKNCGGNAVYSPEHKKMFCPHCDGTDCGERETGNSQLECTNCGAPLTVGEYASTCKCEYCGSYFILDGRVNGNFRPNWILPFQIGKERVVGKLKEEFKRRIFTPDSFLSQATLGEMKGMYVPFWMYDYAVRCVYEGTGTKVRVWVSGDTEYTETSHYRVERGMDIDFDRIPVDASLEMKDDTMDLMEPFDYGQLDSFAEEYMSGFYGEVYNMGADELEGRAVEKASGDAERLLMGTISGYATLRQERKDVDAAKNGVHYALLPVWRYLYRYRGTEYEFYINGQTGKIVGTTPVSKKKVLAYGGTVFAVLWAALSLLLHIVEVI